MLSVLAIGTLIALTGCGDDKVAAKNEVNNWNCRPSQNSFGKYKADPAFRFGMMEQNHEIVDGQEFYYKCKEQKLGYFSKEYKDLLEIESNDSDGDHEKERIAMFNKWKKEAGI